MISSVTDLKNRTLVESNILKSFILSGNKDSMTASDMIHNNIVLVINLLASEALVYN